MAPPQGSAAVAAPASGSNRTMAWYLYRFISSPVFNGPPGQQTPLPVAHLLLRAYIARRYSPQQELTMAPLGHKFIS